jgi:hypothetical protein
MVQEAAAADARKAAVVAEKRLAVSEVMSAVNVPNPEMDGMVSRLGYDRCVLVIDHGSVPACTDDCSAFLVAKNASGWALETTETLKVVRELASGCAYGLGFDPETFPLKIP